MITVRARNLSQQKTFQQVIRYLLITLLSAGLTLALPILFHEAFGVRKELAVALALATAFAVEVDALVAQLASARAERRPGPFA